MPFVDLSYPMLDGQPAYPGDPTLQLRPHATLAADGYRVTALSLGSHHGTHLDAMSHYLREGRTVEAMPLDWFHGPATVLRLPRPPGGRICAEDLRAHAAALQPGARVLLDTGWRQHAGTALYYADFPCLTVDAAHYLAASGIRLLGLDTPSPALAESAVVHRILFADPAEIVVVENLNGLDTLPERVVFMGFPLRLVGCDGSPIRAVAWVD